MSVDIFILNTAVADFRNNEFEFVERLAGKGGYLGVPICRAHADMNVDSVLAAVEEIFAILRKALDTSDVDIMLKCPVRQVGFRRLV